MKQFYTINKLTNTEVVMKQLKRFSGTVFILLFSLAFSLMFFSCENSDLMSARSSNVENSTSPKQLNFLKMRNNKFSLNKTRKIQKWVNRTTGDLLNLKYGDANASSVVYAIDQAAPYNIYLIDPQSVSTPILKGQLAFKSRAIAVHPETGQVYYASFYKIDGYYRMAAWDPVTNTNTILPTGSSVRPGNKLAFALDGTLYGVNSYYTKQLYKINTTTGEWSLFATLNMYLGYYGDMAFAPDGTFYNIDFYNEKNQLQRIDLTTKTVTDAGYISGLGENIIAAGLAFGSDGQAYISRTNGQIYTLDTSTANATFIGSSGISGLYDLASIHFEVELSYANVSLKVLPNSIDVDKEIEISLETTELVGGVAVTFQPHGTVFAPPAILNIEAHGVDFSNVDPSTVNIYYDNPDTGQWEAMQRDDIIVDTNAGTIQVVNAQLPHFSRYALAAD